MQAKKPKLKETPARPAVMNKAVVQTEVQTDLLTKADMWKLVANAAVDAITAIREDGTIILWNERAATMFGWGSDEVDGKKFVQLLLPPAHGKRISKYMREYLETGNETIFDRRLEIFGLAKEGREFPIELSIIPRRTASGHTFVAFVRDMTESNREAERARQSQRMEAIGVLAGGISHEFNNILSSISGNLMLARDDVKTDVAVLESLDEIEKATIRAGYVVRQILTFSSVRTAPSVPVDLEATLTDAIKLLRATLPATLEITLDCEPGLPAVLSDSTEIHQVLLNLGINAQQAMGLLGGVFEVQVTRQTLDERTAGLLGVAPGNYVRMSCGDTGCGMDQKTMSQIFEPFFTTKPVGQGSGLGLSVVYGIIARLKGAITVSSKVGKGTVFHVYFPAVAAPVEKTEAKPAAVRHGNRERILYVDDDEALVYMLTRILRRLNYEVSGFDNPEKALELFRLNPKAFDLVITDMSMPHMNGATLIRELQALRPEIPIVLVTGYVRPQDLEAARNLGVTQLILKPDTVTEMGEALHRIFTETLKSDRKVPVGV